MLSSCCLKRFIFKCCDLLNFHDFAWMSGRFELLRCLASDRMISLITSLAIFIGPQWGMSCYSIAYLCHPQLHDHVDSPTHIAWQLLKWYIK